MARRKIKLGLSMRQLGYHAGGWRHPDVPSGGAMDIHHFMNSAQIAERGLFDLVFLADGLALRREDNPKGSLDYSNEIVELEPLTLLSAVAMKTNHVGLAATASTTYNEPYHVARKFSSLDHISGGRAAWNLVTSWSNAEAKNFNREQHLEYDLRYDRAVEFAQVVKGLWDSFEDTAFTYNKETGQFFDINKMHVLDHRGKHFNVRGPLTLSRCPQGHPIILQAGASEPGQEIAAEHANVVYAAETDLQKAVAYYNSVKSRLAKYGRSTDDLLLMSGILPIIGSTREEAQAKAASLDKMLHPMLGLAYLYQFMGDLSEYPMDGPVPEPKNPELRSRAMLYYEAAKRNNWTIRDLVQRAAVNRGHNIVVGTPSDIVDTMERWLDAGAADGFNVLPAYLPGSAEEFVRLVVPELQRRGLHRESYEGKTLRENLGLPMPRPFYAKG